MVTGKTSSGFCFEISEETLDDMRLVDALAELEESPIAISKVIRLLLGETQKKALYATLQTEDGRVPVDAMTAAVQEIFDAADKNAKNA